jgi:hypothetical protein
MNINIDMNSARKIKNGISVWITVNKESGGECLFAITLSKNSFKNLKKLSK